MKEKIIYTSDGKKKIYSMRMQYRKKPCLAIFEEPNSIVKVASFNNEESAELFMNYIADMMNAKREEE